MYFEISKGYDKLGCKDIGIRKSEFVAKTQSQFWSMYFSNFFLVLIVNFKTLDLTKSS